MSSQNQSTLLYYRAFSMSGMKGHDAKSTHTQASLQDLPQMVFAGPAKDWQAKDLRHSRVIEVGA